MSTMQCHPRGLSPATVLGVLLLVPAVALAGVEALKTAVIKSSAGLCQKGLKCHVDQAGTWVPSTDVAILGVSIPEQTDVDLYVDVEVSTQPQMYMCGSGSPQNAAGCVFRAKYVGPRLFDYGATSGNTYLGSNITTTNITFPAGYGIVIKKRVPVYVHLDVRNNALIDIKVDQDAWIYYVPLK